MDSIDKLIAQVEGEILDERIAVYKLNTSLGKQWAKKRAGLTKRLYNLLERISGLEILKIKPKSKILHDVEVWGFENIINGKSINRIKITSVEGLSERYIDLFQIADRDGMGLELKSESTTLKSVEGGLKDTEMKALFRSSSAIKKQIAKEKKIIAFSKKYGLVIVLTGRIVLTGAFEEVLFEPENIHTTRIISYRKIPEKILPVSIPKPTLKPKLKQKTKPPTDLKPKLKTPDSRKTKGSRPTPTERATTDVKKKAKPVGKGLTPDKPPVAAKKKTQAQRKGKGQADSILRELEELGRDLKRTLTPALQKFERMKATPAPKPEGLGFKTRTRLDEAVASGKPTVAQRGVVRPDEDLGKPDAVKPKVKTPVKPRVVKAKVKPVIVPEAKPTGTPATRPVAKPIATPTPEAPAPHVKPAPAIKPKAPKFRLKIHPKIKGGVLFVLEIAFDFLFAWLDGKKISAKIESLFQKNQDKFESVMNEDKVQQDLKKFRTGENLENGYQLYFFIRLFITRKCSDGGCRTSGSITEIYFMDVSFSRTKGKEFFPDPKQSDEGWDHRYNNMFGEIATLYSPIFDHGESIKPPTEDAADEKFKIFEDYFDKRILTYMSPYAKEYFDDFTKYATTISQSKAGEMYKLLKSKDLLYALTLVELGYLEPLVLVESPHKLSLERILKIVRLGVISKISVILKFYNWVITLDDRSQVYYLELNDKYFKELDDGYKKCDSGCHRGTGDRRIISRKTAIDIKRKYMLDKSKDPEFEITKEEMEEYEEDQLEELAIRMGKP